MHHNHQLVPENHVHNPLHWNYGSPTATSMQTPLTSTPISSDKFSSLNNTWTPPMTRGQKRALSESDCDDIFSEEDSLKEHSVGNESCQQMTRKKRRGVIEKKRRDRINTSLSELKRLVPSAFEKQAKLEKAEILQLTVDHLKSLHTKGVDAIGFDPQRIAMDYHIIGFRECATEVARWMSVEGMDIQDPLRLRLMSHLQCFGAQRELGAKTSAPCSSWSSYQPGYANQGYQPYSSTSVQNESANQSLFNTPFMANNSTYLSTNATPNLSEYSSSGYGTANNTSVSTSVVDSSANATGSSPVPIQTSSSNIAQSESQPIYTDLSNPHDRLPNLAGSYPYGNHHLYASQNNENYNANINNNSKPYRPWHPGSMAY